jgi:hypothetical protein
LPEHITHWISTSAEGSVNGKNDGTEAHGQFFLEEHPQEFFDGALEVGEVDVAVDQQAFDLVEHRRVGDIGVAAVDAARADDADRRLSIPWCGPAPARWVRAACWH